MPITLTTLNIQATARARATRLLPWLLDQRQDVWVLTETSNGPGSAYLVDGLAAARYLVLRPPAAVQDRGVMVATRVPAVVSGTLSLPGRAVVADLDTHPPVLLVGVYVSSNRAPDKVERKRRFLSSLLATLRHLDDADRARLVLCGDYNVIGRDHQPRYRAFLPFEYDFLDALAGLGLRDVFTDHHPGVQAHSWIGRGGNGYRFDYIHIARPLCSRASGCDYIHQSRETGLSDHAGVAVTLDVAPSARGYAAAVPAARTSES